MLRIPCKIIMDKTIKQIWFHNNTDLHINLSGWVTVMDGLSSLKTTVVNPGEKIIAFSTVGEWHLDSMFFNDEYYKPWIQRGLQKYHNVGKFRSQPCASGNYSWMEYDEPFVCQYSEIEDDVKGLITLTMP